MSLFIVLFPFKITTWVEQGIDATAAALPVAVGAKGVGETGDSSPTFQYVTDPNTGIGYVSHINDEAGHMIALNDPQGKAILQRSGLMLSKDGTIVPICGKEVNAFDNNSTAIMPTGLLLSKPGDKELIETNNIDEFFIQTHESESLSTAPGPNDRPKELLTEAVVRYPIQHILAHL